MPPARATSSAQATPHTSEGRRGNGKTGAWATCDNGFHEKAGRSQAGSSLISIPQKVFFSAESTLSPPFHPHS